MAFTPTFEHKTCSRCGGSGHYSYCTMYGTRCFKCGGAGNILTARGRRAQEYFYELLSKPAEQFQPGDFLYIDGIPGVSRSAFYEVEAIELSEAGTGVMINCKGYGYGTSVGTLERYRHSNEAKAAKRAEALAFQATLSPSGRTKAEQQQHRAELKAQKAARAARIAAASGLTVAEVLEVKK